MPARKTTEQFIENSIKIHGDTYDYSKVEYVSNKVKVCIICKEHGDFLQTPNDHIGGHGCRKCSVENHFNYNMKDCFLESNKNVPVDFYVINLFSETESFIKVGISREVTKRHRNIKTKSGYNIECLLIFPSTVEESTFIEKTILHDLRKLYRYTPFVKFPGYKECLSDNSKEEILEKLKTIIVNNYNKSTVVCKILDYEYGR
jgi:hypothetical protein